MKNPYLQACEHYKSIELQTRIESATPHELIHLLLQGARSHIATAQGNIQRNEISEKGMHISKAISIVEGLKTSLDHEKGGEIAANLDKLYDYIQQILLKANLHNDIELLIQANQLLTDIHEAWLAIKVENT
ncbi:flagellar export chaperone FliS [Legionella micdadei]|uniref:Flagellar secretion chaperone FliS n=1 Tax=Legionella micdadei TaxID=451 RepID=A0A098GFS7_LEGMI|nr:flagellar export chaperone FliS [Legionella micdadei]ARG97594.1 flagellar export chaperone FliS [Legionella micdadei]ARH00094.1 flagellar export chaperone FliS [Legionella micdadei]KTD27674.1 flagellar protein FliS [Legionella micdadei]NSL17658.1 flagellar export chaperone FliS [Legionella micdadei]CEG60840.1 B-type flagellar protein fliS [Legionella micdadei]